MKLPINSKGVTLIELLVAIGIAVVSGVLLLVVIVNSAGMFTKQSSRVQGGVNINDALTELRVSIRQSSAVVSSYTVGATTYTTGTDQLVLKVLSVDLSGNLVTDTYDYFVFYREGNVLHFKVFPDPSLSSRKPVNRVFSTVVDSLKLQYFNEDNPPIEVSPAVAKKIKATLTLKQKAGIGVEVNIATLEANLRND